MAKKESGPIIVSIELRSDIFSRLESISEEDFRTINQEISWLVNREFEARLREWEAKLKEEELDEARNA